MTAPSEITVRPAAPDDEPFLFSLFHELRAPEFAAAGLPPAALDGLLAVQFRAQAASFAAELPQAEHYIVLVGQDRAGRLIVRQLRSVLHLVDIGLAPAFRGRGIGTQLLQGLLHRAEANGQALQLQVRAGNPAVRLYLRLGFVAIADNGMDITMERRPAVFTTERGCTR